MSVKIDWSAIPKPGEGEINFRIWKFRASNALKACDLWKIVSGTDLRPEVVGEDQKSWDQADSEAQLALSLIISDPQLRTIRHSNTSKEMWDRLISIHVDDTINNEVVMMSALCGYKAKLNESSLHTYWELWTMAHEIREVGGLISVSVDDEFLAFRIVDCLSDEKYPCFKEKWKMLIDAAKPEDGILERLFHKLREIH